MAGSGKAILAILAGKGKPMSAGSKGMGDDAGGDDSADEEKGESKYQDLAEKAFPDEDWSDPERVSALKEFVMACMDEG